MPTGKESKLWRLKGVRSCESLENYNGLKCWWQLSNDENCVLEAVFAVFVNYSVLKLGLLWTFPIFTISLITGWTRKVWSPRFWHIDRPNSYNRHSIRVGQPFTPFWEKLEWKPESIQAFSWTRQTCTCPLLLSLKSWSNVQKALRPWHNKDNPPSFFICRKFLECHGPLWNFTIGFQNFDLDSDRFSVDPYSQFISWPFFEKWIWRNLDSWDEKCV